MSPTNTAPDVTDPQSLNQYSYADNDPTSPADASYWGEAQDPVEQARRDAINIISNASKGCLKFLRDVTRKLGGCASSDDEVFKSALEYGLKSIPGVAITADQVPPDLQPGTKDAAAFVVSPSNSAVVYLLEPAFSKLSSPGDAWIHEIFHSAGAPNGLDYTDVQLGKAATRQLVNPHYSPGDQRAWGSQNWEKALEKACPPPKNKKCGKH